MEKEREDEPDNYVDRRYVVYRKGATWRASAYGCEGLGFDADTAIRGCDMAIDMRAQREEKPA